jgi:transposase InsO family protein
VTAYRFVDAEKAVWPVRVICRALRVSRSAYYEWKQARTTEKAAEDAVLSVHIKAIHRRSRGTYGVPRVLVDLRAEGHLVGKDRVARLMRLQGLAGTPKRRFRPTTTDSDHTDRVAKNLLDRQFTFLAPNRAWVGDITYLPTKAGWVYLAVLLDLFSRKVVGWSLQKHMQTELCLQALSRAIATRQPGAGLLHHSDRGSQYTSADYQRALGAIGATPSMSRKGNCWDNAVAESFFGTLEQELVLQQEEVWGDENAARSAVGDYIHGFYNQRRRHSTLGQFSPVDFEAAYRAQARAA